MRKQLLVTLTVLITCQLAAQKAFKKSLIYFEAGGNGLGLSFSYERQLKSKPGIGLLIGIGLSGNKPSMISGAKYLIGFGNSKSFFEAGFGITLADREYMGAKRDNLINVNPYTPVFIPSAGYRHHTKYGLMWRVNYTPAFSKYNSIALYPGISVGWIL